MQKGERERERAANGYRYIKIVGQSVEIFVHWQKRPCHPVMIRPIVPPEDLLGTALSSSYIFLLECQVPISLRPPARDLSAAAADTQCVSNIFAENKIDSRAPPFETSCSSVINFNGQRRYRYHFRERQWPILVVPSIDFVFTTIAVNFVTRGESDLELISNVCWINGKDVFLSMWQLPIG